MTPPPGRAKVSRSSIGVPCAQERSERGERYERSSTREGKKRGKRRTRLVARTPRRVSSIAGACQKVRERERERGDGRGGREIVDLRKAPVCLWGKEVVGGGVGVPGRWAASRCESVQLQSGFAFQRFSSFSCVNRSALEPKRTSSGSSVLLTTTGPASLAAALPQEGAFVKLI